MNSQTLTNKKYLTEEEHKILSARLQSLIPFHPRDVAYIALLFQTGARAREALNLRYEDINRTEKTVFIYGSKGSFNREIPIHGWLIDLLHELNPSANPKEKVFKVSYSQVRRFFISIAPKGKTLHALRHTKALRGLTRSNDILAVKQLLGHKSISSTNVYVNHLIAKERLLPLLE